MRFRAFFLFIINIVALIALLYMLDVFGLVDYYSMVKKQFVGAKKRTEDLYLLEKQELEKMRLSLEEREHDISEMRTKLDEHESEISNQIEELKEEKEKISAKWSSYSNEVNEKYQYDNIIEDLASKWGGMPPQKTVDIILAHAKNGEDQLIIDVLLEMDRQAEAAGTASITSYLISLLPPDLSARLLEKYTARSEKLL